MSETKLRVNQIFASIDGEVNYFGQGSPTVFLRLAGCNLRCRYCDTKYAQSISAGKDMSPDGILDAVRAFGLSKVTITGGEPMMQLEEVKKICALFDFWRIGVSIETNGSFPINPYHYSRARFVVDYKLPSSGVSSFMTPFAFISLTKDDFVKFVIADRADFDLALEKISELVKWGCNARYAFSPMIPAGARDTLFARTLAQWLLDERINGAIFNVQIHKLIDLSEPDKQNI